jgi:hypothetical protein
MRFATVVSACWAHEVVVEGREMRERRGVESNF